MRPERGHAADDFPSYSEHSETGRDIEQAHPARTLGGAEARAGAMLAALSIGRSIALEGTMQGQSGRAWGRVAELGRLVQVAATNRRLARNSKLTVHICSIWTIRRRN